MAQDLFGGAMKMTLPANVVDVSDIRQVPDNQEVFSHPDTDQSLIVEIMEMVPEDALDKAARTHFEDLAGSNDALANSAVTAVNILPTAALDNALELSGAVYLQGRQEVSKYGEAARNTVELHLLMLRSLRYTTDVLVTFNNPARISSASSSHRPVATSVVPWTAEEFVSCATSLKLIDSGLFGQEQEEEDIMEH